LNLSFVFLLAAAHLFSWSVGFGMGWTLKPLPNEYGLSLLTSAVFVSVVSFIFWLALR